MQFSELIFHLYSLKLFQNQTSSFVEQDVGMAHEFCLFYQLDTLLKTFI